MAHDKNCSSCIPPECSTPIFTVSIPGGLAISLFGIQAEVGPIYIAVYAGCTGSNDTCTPEAVSFPVGTKPDTGSEKGVFSDTACQFEIKCLPERLCNSDNGEPKPSEPRKCSKHPKPLKPPKCSKHAKLSKPSKCSKHAKPPKPPKCSKHPKPPKPPKCSKHPKPPKPPKCSKHPKPTKIPKHPGLPKPPNAPKHTK